MKKLIVLISLFIASVAFATPVTTLFTNSTSTVTETEDGTLKRGESVYQTVFCNYTNVGGSTTALTVNLDGSIDNSNYETLASHAFTADELTNREAMFHVYYKPVTAVMGNISSLTDTGTTYVSCWYWGYRIPDK